MEALKACTLYYVQKQGDANIRLSLNSNLKPKFAWSANKNAAESLERIPVSALTPLLSNIISETPQDAKLIDLLNTFSSCSQAWCVCRIWAGKLTPSAQIAVHERKDMRVELASSSALWRSSGISISGSLSDRTSPSFLPNTNPSGSPITRPEDAKNPYNGLEPKWTIMNYKWTINEL